MDTIKKLFPISFNAINSTSFITALIIYIIGDIICGLVIGLLAKIPLLGLVFSLIGGIAGLYFTAGIILAILVFLKVIKD